MRPKSPEIPFPPRGIFARIAALVLLPAALSAAGPQPRSEAHLERIRLLPPVLIQGEKGDSLEERMRHYNAVGVSVAVIRDFRVLWAESHGFADRETSQPATRDTLFQAGSISKPVAAAAVLREVQAGKLALDRDVNDYLKSWKVPESPAAARQKVTLERILSHSAGLTVHGFPGYAAGETIPTVPEVLDGKPPANTPPVRVDLEPGSKYRYSGGGYTVAQLAMTDTFGKPFPVLLRELVLAPAGMTHSTYDQPLPADRLRLAAAGYRADGRAVEGKRHTYPEMAAAGLWTTAEDLAKFAIAIQKSRRGDAGSLLSKSLAERMTTPFAEHALLGFATDRREGEAYFLHNGADEGFQALLVASRDHGYGAAVMVNSDNGVALAEEIVRGIAREEGWKWQPAEIAIVPLAPADLAGLPGRYRINGDEALALRVQGARVFASQAGSEFELFPASRDRFVRRDRATKYEIERSGEGRDSTATATATATGAVRAVTIETQGDRFVANRLASDALLPSELLAMGRVDEAVAGYRRLFADTPDDPGIAEARLNSLGYRFAGQKDFDKAVAMLKLNTELRPASSNTWDSLGEIYLARGDRRRSLESYRRSLEEVQRDTKTDPALRDQLRRNAEAKIRELSAP